MMVHMEESDLPILFPDDEENRVEELRHFCQEVYVDACCNLKIGKDAVNKTVIFEKVVNKVESL